MKEQLLELIFPPRCAVCTEVLDMEERRGILCHDCAEQLPYVPKGICPHCGGVTETAGFCEQLSARTGLPFRRDILVRKRETAAQSTLDSSKQRRQNLKNAFAVTEDLTGKQVLLVDDIFTTGTTCNECAKELYRAGAQKVFVCCLSAAGKLS